MRFRKSLPSLVKRKKEEGGFLIDEKDTIQITSPNNVLFYSDSALGWTVKNNNSITTIDLKGSNNSNHGGIIGQNGEYVGLTDAFGRWAIQHRNNNYTRFYDANELVFHIGQGHNGSYGTVATYGVGVGNWEGYNINSYWAFAAPDFNSFGIMNDSDNEWMIRGVRNNAVELYYDNLKKFNTLTDGVRVENNNTTSRLEMYANGGLRGNLFCDLNNNFGLLDAQNRWAVLHSNGNHTRFYDNGELIFHIGQGLGGDYGSVSTYGNGSGGWEGYSINGYWTFMAPDNNQFGIYNDFNNEWMIRGVANNAIELYYDGQKKFSTTSDGIRIESSLPRIYLTDTNSNPDYSIANVDGLFRIINDTGNSVPLQIDSNGNSGFNVTNSTSRVDINGTAMRQFRLRTSGGPTGNGDINGQEGDFAYDDQYFYIKTGSGWGRIALDFGF